MHPNLVQLQRLSEKISEDARLEERQAALSRLALEPHHVVLDVPAWGGYFSRGLEHPARVICLDPDPSIVRCPGARVLGSGQDHFPLGSQSVDRVVSLVGVHHLGMPIRNLFWKETARVLKPRGRLVASEVLAGSPVARFLNREVDRFSERGHRGVFLDTGELKASLEAVGFEEVTEEVVDLTWRFTTQAQMISYCRALFAMTMANDTEVLTALCAHFAVQVVDGRLCLPWRLLYGVGVKR